MEDVKIPPQLTVFGIKHHIRKLDNKIPMILLRNLSLSICAFPSFLRKYVFLFYV